LYAEFIDLQSWYRRFFMRSLTEEETKAVEKVRSFLEGEGYEGEIFFTEDTIFTVEDASRAVGVRPEEILKSLVLLADDKPILVLMSGPNKVDIKKIKRMLGARKVKMADPGYVYEYTGYRIGGVPPVGYPEKPKAFIDEDVFLYDTLWAAAGSEHSFFPVGPLELARLASAEKADLKKEKKQNNNEEAL
jgi:prolyl-tRNA editing enzyme YbaK/EbsC (Cys-tRNA(Pro) deacylase)